MNSLFSPHELQVILWYHSRASDWDGMNVPIWGQTAKKLIHLDLLTEHIPSEIDKRHFKPTEKLHAYVEGLCNLPLPIQKWVIPNE
jgi:hypothetical protein